MHDLAAELFPIHRSITGPGVRTTLARLRELVPLSIHEVPTGTRVFDWEVPEEWTIRDAYIQDERGRRLVDFRQCNLHVVGGSRPIRARLRWQQLKPHLHTLPEHPQWIPYRTAFHADTWGFAVSHEQFQQFERSGDRQYEVCIDAALEPGSLTYGELLLPGETNEEVLFSTHVCHPSLANDGLSGMVVAVYLARHLAQCASRRYSYRFVFVPATIGAITWLALHEDILPRIRHGCVLSCCGDPGAFTYKKSRRGDAEIDRAFAHVLRHGGHPHRVLEFEPFGYDQRQYCSPGINLPVGNLMRTPNECYPQYHTSADDLTLIRPEALAETWRVCCEVCALLEGNRRYRNRFPKGEPRLGPRGLYHAFGSRPDRQTLQKAVLWVLNLSDGEHSLLDIARRAELPFSFVREAADLLLQSQLLEELD